MSFKLFSYKNNTYLSILKLAFVKGNLAWGSVYEREKIQSRYKDVHTWEQKKTSNRRDVNWGRCLWEWFEVICEQ